MRLAEFMALRTRAGAGALVTLTERCPLHCAHCSTASTQRGRHLDPEALLGFLRTFTPERRPEVLVLTGGEPLLRAELVAEAAEAARVAGTRTAVLTGAFFLRGKEVPLAIRRAFAAVDHVSLSLDVFHEREVGRAEVFGLLRELLDAGVATSLHVVGTGDDDPYLADVIADVTAHFGVDVPMLVGTVRPLGRAADWAKPAGRPPAQVSPCAMAAWPVCTVDGRITACCNQDVVDGRARPAHLGLGDLATTSWAEVTERLESPVLRSIRTVGPGYLAGCAGGCGTCLKLDASALARAELTGGGIASLLQPSGGPVDLLERYGSRRYAHLVGTAR
ncbi:radical SAM protein [Amycolatopsis sp. NPDC049253]|uniref:radical SAM protein n=1 Tax=Amycolatopsis sp. NPDC049253 TaxID=3155274 RepID=UPI003445E866